MIGKTNASPGLKGPDLSAMVVEVENQTSFDAVVRFQNFNGIRDSAVLRRFLISSIDADLTELLTIELNTGMPCAVDYYMTNDCLYITAYETE